MRVRFAGHHWHLPLVLLWLLESVVAVGAFIAATGIRHFRVDSAELAREAAAFALPLIIAMVAMGLFTRRQRDGFSGVLLRVTLSVVIAVLVAAAIYSLSPDVPVSHKVLALAGFIAWVVLLAIRFLGMRLIDEEAFKRRIVVLGAGRNAGRIASLRRRSDRRGFVVIGYVPLDGEAIAVPQDRLLPTDTDLPRFSDAHDIDEIVVAMDDRRRSFPVRSLLDCRLTGVDVTESVLFLERETGKVYLELVQPSWIIFGAGFRNDMMRRWSERVFDLGASSLLLLLASPVMLLAALAIKLEEGLKAPVFYSQQRVGFQGRLFSIVKFRSMRVDAEKNGAQWAVRNDHRVTRIGGLMRKTRIDELPQLFSVLEGKMSFVGPRPERPEFVKTLTETIPFYQERHSVKPGITGWAQLCYPYGASEHDAREKLQYDLFYVKHHGLLFDILILLQTVEVILLGKGAR
jgi:sugar transferase (PEP-CTERM system associated)